MPKIWFVASDYFTYHRRLNIHMYYASKLRRLEIQLHDLTQINLESWFAFRLLCFFIFFSLWRLLQSLLCSPYLYSSNILSKRVLKADSRMFSPSLSRLLSFRLLSNKIKIIWLRLSTIDLLSPELLPDFIHIILMNLNVDLTITGIIAPFVYSPLCREYSVKRRNIFFP